MLRRLFSIVTGTMCVTCLVVLAWKPVELKTKLFNSLAQSIPPSVPYDVKIARVSGSFIHGLIFDDVRLVKRSSSHELLHITRVTLEWSWRALLFHKQFQINRMIVDLDHGEAILQGALTLSPVPSGHYEVDDHNFPLQELTAFIGQPVPSLSVRHTGRWTIRKDSGTVVMNLEGRLENSPAAFHLSWNPDPRVLLNGGGQWTSPLADIRFKVHKGIGDYEGFVGTSQIKSAIQGQIDLFHKSIVGHGVLQDVTWQDAHLGHMNFSYSADALHQSLDVQATDLQMHKEQSRPADISAAHIVLRGLWPRWSTQAAASFRNGSTATVQGHLIHENESWILAWQKAAFSFPLAGTWSSLRPGTASWSKTRMTLRNAEFGNGAQNVKLTSAEMDGKQYRFDLVANQLNLSPWTKLFFPEVSLEGNLNTSLRVVGTPKELHVDGYLNGQFPQITVDAIGLSLQDINVELRSQNQKVEIVQFTGRSKKKSNFRLTGSSVLPQLDYAMHVHRLPLEPFEHMKAIIDADFALSGSWESPLLTGLVTLDEGNYVASKKDEKKNAPVSSSGPCCQNGRVDLKVVWLRNVWYHEGVSSIETKANLRVQKKADSPLTMSGVITSLRGSYNYFGRNFNIESGQMQFTGEPGFNPVLAIEASYTSGPTEVYLDMGGTVKSPTLTMHSNPPLPNQDIISVIVFGQPLNTLRASSGGASTNQEAMQAVGGVLGSYITKGLNQSGMSALNLDVINIQPADQGGSQLMLGRYLTKKLFVNYGQTVQGSAEKTISASYFLTDKWTLQGTSDSVEGNYMDFLFRYPLNKRQSAVNTSPVPHSPFRDSLDSPVLPTQFRTPMQ